LITLGCSSSKSATTGQQSAGASNESTASTASATSAAVAKAQAYVAKLYQASSPLPTQAFKAGKHKLFIISPSQADYSQLMQYVVNAGKAIGWQLSPICDTERDPTKGSACILQAINQGYNGIVYVGAPFPSLTTPVEEATAKGIWIAANDPGAPSNAKVLYVDSSYSLIGDAIAAQTIIQIHGKGKILTFPDPTYESTVQAFAAFDQYIKANCPLCTVVKESFAATDLAQPGPPEWTAALAANPPGTVAAAVAPYDGAAEPFAKTESAAGRSDIPVLSMGPIDSISRADLESPTSPLVATTTGFDAYQAWLMVDAIARAITGTPQWPTLGNMPFEVVTRNNVGQLAPAPDNGPTVAGNYQAALEKLWGVS
jgi:ABC-type sugar transport system substrate-binding protein